MPAPSTSPAAASRMQRHRKAIQSAGGRQVAVLLSADAVTALDELTALHGTAKAAIEAALIAQAEAARYKTI